MTPERKEIEKAKAPSLKDVQACLKGCRGYRQRMANSVSGPVQPSLKEQIAQALLDHMKEVEQMKIMHAHMMLQVKMCLSVEAELQEMLENQRWSYLSGYKNLLVREDKEDA
jgi:hypothetical protein